MESLDLKKKIEEINHTRFNSCLLNLYHDGNGGMAWHSDGEKALGNKSVIASLSFGAESFHLGIRIQNKRFLVSKNMAACL
jgi:alkylated DNA repair dioxygenase AlkB